MMLVIASTLTAALRSSFVKTCPNSSVVTSFSSTKSLSERSGFESTSCVMRRGTKNLRYSGVYLDAGARRIYHA